MLQRLLTRLAPPDALRQVKRGEETPRVTNMELFFDLVYVFTIIQLSHYLLAHQTWLGAIQFATIFAAVWWAWNYTAWATNWLDPDHPAGRVLMVVLMGCALLMAVAIPSAYSGRASIFVGAYVAMALLRAGYMALVFRGEQMGTNYAQLGAWSVLSAAFWIAGAALPSFRTVLWLAAVLVDYAAPYAGFWIPGLGGTPMSTWPLSGLHLLERNQLIFIIALGESILLLGGTLIEAPLGLPYLLSAGAGFLIIVSMWALYFGLTAGEGEEAFEYATEQTQMARASLAYSHGIMVGGAIVVAVAIEEVIAHPSEAAHLPTLLTATLGPAIYLGGSLLFARAVSDQAPASYILALAGLALAGVATYLAHASGLVLGMAVSGVMLALLASRVLRRQRRLA